jgi:hypothetical protein
MRCAKGECRFPRIAEHSIERTAAAGAYAQALAVGLRMDKDQRLQFFGLGPERIEFPCGEFVVADAAADRDAAQAQRLDRIYYLFGGRVRELQRDRRKGGKSIRISRAELGELLDLEVDDAAREIAVGTVSEGIDAERLKADAIVIHIRNALEPDRHHLIGAGELTGENLSIRVPLTTSRASRTMQ